MHGSEASRIGYFLVRRQESDPAERPEPSTSVVRVGLNQSTLIIVEVTTVRFNQRLIKADNLKIFLVTKKRIG